MLEMVSYDSLLKTDRFVKTRLSSYDIEVSALISVRNFEVAQSGLDMHFLEE